MADHVLLLRALLLGVARWEAFDGSGGELCFEGLRYSCDLDAEGFPILSANTRADLARALFRKLEARNG